MEEHNLRRPTGLGISLNSFAGGPSASPGHQYRNRDRYRFFQIAIAGTGV